MRTISTITAAATLLLAGGALAQDRGVPGIDVDINTDAKVNMPNVDKNSDGKVSRSEAASDKQLSQQFDKLDANKDGNLDKGEFAKFEAKGKAKGNAKGTSRNPQTDEGEPANPNDTPGTTDDSTPGNPDQLGPGR